MSNVVDFSEYKRRQMGEAYRLKVELEKSIREFLPETLKLDNTYEFFFTENEIGY